MKRSQYIAPAFEVIDISPFGETCHTVSNVDPGNPFDGNDEVFWTI